MRNFTMRLLIIEDSEIQADGIKNLLEQELKLPTNTSLSIDIALDIYKAESKIQLNRYDIAIIDINLQHIKLNGFAMMNQLKKFSPYCRIIIRSALPTDDNYRKAIKVASSGLTILDFISKSDVGDTDLINILQNIINGSSGKIIEYKDLKHQIGSMEVQKGNSIITLGVIYGLLLDKFMQNLGIILTYDSLYECYPHRGSNDLNKVAQVCSTIYNLRKKLSPNSPNEYIHNASGIGYYFGDKK